jgi:hypothetical protein
VDGTDGEFQGEREKRKPGLESAVNVNTIDRIKGTIGNKRKIQRIPEL